MLASLAASIPAQASSASKVKPFEVFRGSPPFQLFMPEPGDMLFADWFTSSRTEQRIGDVVAKLLGTSSPYGYSKDRWAYVDVGMNRGFQTLLPARLGYEVLAMEAMPSCVAQAYTTLSLNNLMQAVRVLNVGVARRDHGYLTVRTSDECTAGNSIVSAQPEVAGTVPLRSLASLLSSVTKGVAVLKMDIEGSEMEALHPFGVASLISRRVENVIVEVISHFWRHSFGDGVRFLESLAAESEGAYCLDPWVGNNANLTCPFRKRVDDDFGVMHAILDMRGTVMRFGEGRNRAACCGNLWFKGIGRAKRSTSTSP